MDSRILAQHYDAARIRGVEYERQLGAAEERLESLHADVVLAKAAIREILDILAAKHGITVKDINYAMEGYANNMLSDATYSVERDIEGEIDALKQEIKG